MKPFAHLACILALAGCGHDTRSPSSWVQPEGPAAADSIRTAVFADTSLEAAVREALEKPAGSLTQAALDSLTQLVARGRGIASLAGIDALRNLQILDLADNQIQDISPLAFLTQLTYLNLADNQVRDIAPLSALTHLGFLGLDRNPVGDISPLLALDQLIRVGLAGVMLADTVASHHLASLREQGVEVRTAESDSAAYPTPAGPISNTRILFSSKADAYSSFEIFTMDTDGGGWAKLLSSSGTAWGCTWSPDGQQIAYVASFGDVWVINRDGTWPTRKYHSRNTADVLGALAWSPDGRRIAFVKGRHKGTKIEDWQVYTMSATGTDTLRLTNDSAGWRDGPCWSPDGKRIAFVSSHAGKPDIYVMNADGSNRVQLTDDPVSTSGPAWSPDGRRIAFASERDGNSEIYVMNADGSDPVRLTHEPALDNGPTWSPDSREIAFATQRDGNGDIYAMQADGSGLVNLTRATSDEWDPKWSPA